MRVGTKYRNRVHLHRIPAIRKKEQLCLFELVVAVTTTTVSKVIQALLWEILEYTSLPNYTQVKQLGCLHHLITFSAIGPEKIGT